MLQTLRHDGPQLTDGHREPFIPRSYQHLLKAYGLVCIQGEWDQAEPIQGKKIDWLSRNKHAVQGRLKYLCLCVYSVVNTPRFLHSWINLPYRTQRNVGSWVINRFLVVIDHSIRWQYIFANAKAVFPWDLWKAADIDSLILTGCIEICIVRVKITQLLICS
jgi:hypothetical protein